jgi:hypothetical protein
MGEHTPNSKVIASPDPVLLLRATLDDANSEHPRLKCDLCGRRVRSRWCVMVESLLQFSNDQSTTVIARQLCVICMNIAKQQGHTVYKPVGCCAVLPFPTEQVWQAS